MDRRCRWAATSARSKDDRVSVSTMTSTMDLLALPLVVVDNLLDHLDFRSLKTLRLVSKTTKDWVEKPRHLQRMKIYIGMCGAEELMSSTTGWNNWHLDPVGYLLQPFMVKYGPVMEHLEIVKDSFVRGSNEFERILSHLGPRMKTLVIPSINIELPETVYKDWMTNFKDLKTFQINHITHFDDTKRTLFDLILNECSKLTHLTIPSLTQHGWKDSTDAQYYNLVFQPVLNYLRRIEQTKGLTNLTIHFKNQRIHTPHLLFQLVGICSRLGVVLSNFPVTSLPENSQNLTNVKRLMLDKTIISAYAWKHPKDDQSLQTNRYIPHTTKMKIRVSILNNEDSFVIQDPVHTLRFYCSGYTYATMNRNLFVHLFRTHRPTVEKLKCLFLDCDYNHTRVRFGRQISESFPNLRSLSLERCSCVCFYSLFNGLHVLEKLKIAGCRLTDHDVLGYETSNPPILHLQNLSHLELLQCANGFTDESFMNAIKKMRLTTFVWTRTLSSKVTFQNGISSLRASGFGDAIRHFRIERPYDCTEQDVRQFININFPNIHDYSLWDPPDHSSTELELQDVESDSDDEEGEEEENDLCDFGEEEESDLDDFEEEEEEEKMRGEEDSNSSNDDVNEDGQLEN